MIGHLAYRASRRLGQLLRARLLQHEIAQVHHRVRDLAPLGPRYQLRILGAQHQGAGRARRDDLAPGTDRRKQGLHVPAGELARSFQIAAVHLRHPAADLLGVLDLAAGFLQDVDGGLADRRIVVVHVAGGEERDRCLAPRDRRPPRPPGREGFLGIRGQLPVLGDADGPVHQHPVERVVRGGVGERRDPRHHAADQIGRSEEAFARRDPLFLRPDQLRPQHQLGEVDCEFVGRHVRTLGEAELALVAELDHPVLVLVVQEVDGVLGRDRHVLEQLGRLVLLDDLPALDVLALRLLPVRVERVDAAEEHVEGGAEIEAEPAAVADLEHAVQLRLEVRAVPELRVVVRHPVRVGGPVLLAGDG